MLLNGGKPARGPGAPCGHCNELLDADADPRALYHERCRPTHTKDYDAERPSRTTRRTRPRSKTIAPKKLSREEMMLGARLLYPDDVERPATRGDCKGTPRPCPFVSCRHHLYLDVNPSTGSIKLNFPDLDVAELKESCSLDVADRGGITLEEVGEILNLTRERVRQVEVRGLLRLRASDAGDDE